jgi:pimeloyl-ACP methyl ester carboxylesterase
MPADFEREIGNPQLPVVADLTFPGEPLLMAFHGIAGRMAAFPPFEFFKLTRDLRVNKAYLRDLDQRWYHGGLRGVTGSIGETAHYLRRMMRACRPRRTVLFGSSMGGYAALLFGSLIGASAVHAFSPHTTLRDRRSIRNRDKLKALHEGFSGEYFDLSKVPGVSAASGEDHVYYDLTDRKDRRQVSHLEGRARLHLHPYRGGGHNLVKHLKASGELEKLVTASIKGLPYEPRSDIPLRRSLLDRLLGRKVA